METFKISAVPLNRAVLVYSFEGGVIYSAFQVYVATGRCATAVSAVESRHG